jgi:hypothetical protein
LFVCCALTIELEPFSALSASVRPSQVFFQEITTLCLEEKAVNGSRLLLYTHPHVKSLNLPSYWHLVISQLEKEEKRSFLFRAVKTL